MRSNAGTPNSSATAAANAKDSAELANRMGPPSGKLVEEVASAGEAELAAKLPAPAYAVEPRRYQFGGSAGGARGSDATYGGMADCLTVKVHMPLVSSADELDLKLSREELELYAPGTPLLYRHLQIYLSSKCFSEAQLGALPQSKRQHFLTTNEVAALPPRHGKLARCATFSPSLNECYTCTCFTFADSLCPGKYRAVLLLPRTVALIPLSANFESRRYACGLAQSSFAAFPAALVVSGSQCLVLKTRAV